MCSFQSEWIAFTVTRGSWVSVLIGRWPCPNNLVPEDSCKRCFRTSLNENRFNNNWGVNGIPSQRILVRTKNKQMNKQNILMSLFPLFHTIHGTLKIKKCDEFLGFNKAWRVIINTYFTVTETFEVWNRTLYVCCEQSKVFHFSSNSYDSYRRILRSRSRIEQFVAWKMSKPEKTPPLKVDYDKND